MVKLMTEGVCVSVVRVCVKTEDTVSPMAVTDTRSPQSSF